MGYTIYHNFIISASKEKVYDGISDPEQLINWWPAKCSGKPVLGAAYNFYFKPEYDWWGKVIKCERGKAFHIKMTQSDKDWDPTSFGFDLEETQGGVQVSFWHTDWPACNQHFKIASFCWAILLQGLKNYVEKGIIIPFENRN